MLMLSREEYLKSIGKTEEKLVEEGLELVKYDDGSPEALGWEVRYKDETCTFSLGCPCSDSGTVHDKL